MKRLMTGLCVAGAFAASTAASATAAPPHWWVSAPTAELAKGTPLNMTSGGVVHVASNVKGKGVKCVPTDNETVENPLAGGPGVDELHSWYGKCVPGTTIEHIEPCVPGESWSIGAVGLPWKSELIRVGTTIRDEFFGSAFEVLCQSSGAHLTYVEALPLQPRLTINKFTYGGPAFGRWISGPFEIVFRGSQALTPEAPWTQIFGK